MSISTVLALESRVKRRHLTVLIRLKILLPPKISLATTINIHIS